MRRLPVGDDVELAVTLSTDGSIGIHHTAASRPDAHAALRRLAAQTTHHAARVHLEGLADVEPRIRVRRPFPGQAVMACGCGRMMNAGDMRYLPMRRGDATFIRPIVCRRCAA